MGKHKNVPKLRFPGFDGEWESLNIGTIAKVKHGFAFKGEFFAPEGTFIIVTPGNFDSKGGFRFQGDKEKYYTDSNFPKDYILEKGDLLTAMTEQAEGLIGNAIIIPKSNIFLHNQRLGLFQVNEKAFRPFLYQLMMTSPIREKFSKSAAGTKVRHTSPQLIERIKFNLPTLPEQTKIADFLSDVDEKLQALKQKKTALETYKKGLMQKLFSQALRFKDADGKDFPDWEEKELGDFHEIKMGQSPSSHSYNIESNGVPLIQGNADIRNRLTEPRNFTSEITKVCFPGDLILTVRAPVGAIAKSNHYACIGRGVCAISSKNNCCIEFTYQFLLSYEPKWGNLEQGSTFTAVNSNDIRSLKIPFPSLAEQTKIADLLSSLDEKIAGTALASEKLEVWKKGLLQKVFV